MFYLSSRVLDWILDYILDDDYVDNSIRPSSVMQLAGFGCATDNSRVSIITMFVKTAKFGRPL